MFSSFSMNMSSLSSYSPSSSSIKRKRDSDSYDEPFRYKRAKYDIFMNYSYKDIGNSFISHLRGALKQNDFTIYELLAGQSGCSELLKPIEDSHIYLVVFSCKYASSVRCLDELVDIMDSSREFARRKVFPVFFKVEPSHVRNQDGVFKEAFEAHKTNFSAERVEKWRQAMKDVGLLPGEHLRYGNEEKFLRKIVKVLSKMKNPLQLLDATYPVGIESRVEDIISKLRLGDNVFTLVAVFGIGGSGKTTIAKAVYDIIAADFNAKCFIENMHDYKNSGRNWKVDLQEKVISHLTGKYKFHNNYGLAKIGRFLTTQKVLLVLDGVDDFEQLKALGIHLAPFGCGSRIIVTTRNKQSLNILPFTPYDISLLNRNESFELFTGFAFEKDEHVDKNFVKEIVWRAEGLPLVLEVWGRHFKCHERKQWPSVLETLQRIPHGDVQKQLQMSYDSLPNRSKKLFLDIVFFLCNEEKDLVVKVLHDEETEFSLDIEIQYLVDKSLVEIVYDKVSIHQAIKDMGKEVVRQENEDEPGQRTRLMGFRDVVRVLRDCSGTKSVEGIQLGYNEIKERVTLQVEAFKTMSNLRFIRLLDTNRYKLYWWSSSSNDDMSYFSFKKLKYLEWYNFPFKSFDNIDMGNVVVIKLHNSKLEKLWEGFKSLKKLRILDTSYSRSLTKTGNFSGVEKLEELILRNCKNLEELDSSICCLEKLVRLDLTLCKQSKRLSWEMIGSRNLHELEMENCSLSHISSEIGNLVSLRHLNLSKNPFSSIPDIFCNLSKLIDINMDDCSQLKLIPNLPPSIKRISASGCISLVNLPSNMSELQFLEKLVLDGCCNLEPEGLMKVTGLRNLDHLRMENCNVSEVSSEIGNLVSLESLYLSKNTCYSLPESVGNLSELSDLTMTDCSELKLLPLLPSNLRYIEVSGCWSLDVMPYDPMQKAYIFRSKMFEESFFAKDETLWITLSGIEVPEWCNYKSNGHALSFVAPMMHMDNKICGVIICATLTTELEDDQVLNFFPTMLNKTKETSHHFYCPELDKGSMFLMFYPLNDKTLVVEAGDTVLLEFDAEDGLSSCGINLIYEGDVVDDYTLLVQKQHTEPPFTLTVPLEMNAPTSAIINQCYDDSVL